MPGKPSPRQVAKAIQAALEAVADLAFATQGQTFFKEPVKLLGVRAADMHRLAREAYLHLKTHWKLADAIALCDLLMPDPRIEPKAVTLLVCERFSREFETDLLPIAQQWIERGYCDSWGMIDTISPCIIGPLVTQYPELLNKTRKWTTSSNLWLRRAAVVSLIKPARRGEMLDDAYDMAARLFNDPEDLVQKATGWLLREAGKTDMARLKSFLHKHGPRMARTTLRYAIERFPPAVRHRLLEETRASTANKQQTAKRIGQRTRVRPS